MYSFKQAFKNLASRKPAETKSAKAALANLPMFHRRASARKGISLDVLRHISWVSPNPIAAKRRISRQRRRLRESAAWREELERRAVAGGH